MNFHYQPSFSNRTYEAFRHYDMLPEHIETLNDFYEYIRPKMGDAIEVLRGEIKFEDNPFSVPSPSDLQRCHVILFEEILPEPGCFTSLLAEPSLQILADGIKRMESYLKEEDSEKDFVKARACSECFLGLINNTPLGFGSDEVALCILGLQLERSFSKAMATRFLTDDIVDHILFADNFSSAESFVYSIFYTQQDLLEQRPNLTLSCGMDRVENEPEVAELYQQALAEHKLLEAALPAAEQELAQEQVREAERQRLIAEKQRLEQKNDLDLGM